MILEALNSGWPICLIDGMGGAGKTTLALEVAYACAGQPRGEAAKLKWPEFSFIIWTTGEGNPLTIDDLLDAIAYRLGYSGLTQKPRNEKREAVADILAQQSTLLIVDNFETVSDATISDFLVKVPQGVKVLLTSREEEKLLTPIFRRYPPARVRIGGLPDNEALVFLRQEARRLVSQRMETDRLKAVATADDDTLLPLIRVTDGNPKALELALGYIADHAMPLKSMVHALYAGADSVGQLFNYFFHHAWERSSGEARALWLVIPFFAAPACKDALKAAAGLQGRFFYDALEQMQGRSLVDTEESPDGEPRYRAHPLVRSFALPHLRDFPEFEATTRERWIDWYLDFLKRHDPQDWPLFKLLEQEFENIQAVISWALENHHPQAPALVKSFWHYPYIRGYWRLVEELTHRAMEQAAEHENTPLRLWLASHLGWIWEEQDKFQEARQQLERVKDEIQALDRPDLLVETDVLNYLGQAHQGLGNLKESAEYQTHFLILAQEHDDRRGALVARYHLALTELEQGHLQEAASRFKALVQEAQAMLWQRAEGYCAYRLASALIRLGLVDEAENWLDHAGRMADRWEEPLLQAHVIFGRAYAQKTQGQLETARHSAQVAVERYQRLGMTRRGKEAIRFLEELVPC